MYQKDISSQSRNVYHERGKKMETSDTLISLVGIFETKVKHCRKKNGLSINYSWHKYRELKGTLL